MSVVPFGHRFDSDIESADDADDGYAFAVMLFDDSFVDDAGVMAST